MTDKVFVSYHHDSESEVYKRMLMAWSANDTGTFDLKFQDLSIGVSINSKNADYIKRRIAERIRDCNKFLCLIGKNTHNSDWVAWEINKAVALGKKIVAVKINSSYSTPVELYGVGASWAQSFTYESIKKALD